ncbi:unnamed protein product [Musa acuminata subsp. burmannicoides]
MSIYNEKTILPSIIILLIATNIKYLQEKRPYPDQRLLFRSIFLPRMSLDRSDHSILNSHRKKMIIHRILRINFFASMSVSSYAQPFPSQQRKETQMQPQEEAAVHAVGPLNSRVVSPADEHGDAAAYYVEPRPLLLHQPRAPARER